MAEVHPDDDDHLIGAVPKGRSGGEIRVALREYRSTRFLDLRLNVVGADGDLLPTKQGVTVPIDRLDDLAELVDRARAEARRLGWTSDVPEAAE